MQKRTIWKVLVFTILTLGIYRLYWFIKTRREMMSQDPSIRILSPLFLVIPILFVALATGAFIVNVFQNTANIPSHCTDYSHPNNETTRTVTAPECEPNQSLWPIIAFYVAIILIGPLIAWWLWGYSKGVEKITKEKTSFAMAMIVLLLVPDGIDILIIQDSFNKLTPELPTTTLNQA